MDKQAAVLVDEIQYRIDHHFRRPETRRQVRLYIEALLKQVKRKNSWQLAEAVGQLTPYKMQRLLKTARWDVDAVRDELRSYVAEYLACPEGVLVVGEYHFPKRGYKPVGLLSEGKKHDRKGNRTWEMFQTGIFLAYTTPKGTAFIDRALYLPYGSKWISNKEIGEDGTPKTRPALTKPEIARQMVERALDEGVSCRWVIADLEFSLNPYTPTNWWRHMGKPYILLKQSRDVSYTSEKDMCSAQLKEVASKSLESFDQGLWEARTWCGLADYEVRSWTGWHRHITLSLLAHALLVVNRARADNIYSPEEVPMRNNK